MACKFILGDGYTVLYAIRFCMVYGVKQRDKDHMTCDKACVEWNRMTYNQIWKSTFQSTEVNIN